MRKLGKGQLNSRLSRMFGRRIRMLVAVAVVFSTTYSLILPAITIDANTAAAEPGMEVFREPADYTLACRFIPHAHTEDCYIEKDILDAEGNPTGQRERVLICGKEDYAVHVHNEDCYDEDGILVCPLPEIYPHEHDDSCWKTEKRLECSIPEHVHTEDCYADIEVGTERQLSCGYNEGDVISPAVYSDPVYSEVVYDEAGELVQDAVLQEEPQLLQEEVVHHHTDECYTEVPVFERQLICKLEEHTHSDACYKEERVLICGKHELHKHTEECYERGPDGESPVDMGWAWYEEENGEQILNGDPAHRKCGKTELLEHVHGDACFEEAGPEAGVIEDAVVPAAEYDPGEENRTEDQAGAEAEDTAATETAVQQKTFYASTDNVEVTVIYEAGTFPEGTVLSVTDVEDDDTISSICGAASGDGQDTRDIVRVHAADITFYDKDGKSVEPAKPVRVIMSPVEEDDITEAATVEVVHMSDDGQAEIIEQTSDFVPEQSEDQSLDPASVQTGRQITNQETLLSGSASASPAGAVFETSSFSVYALVYRTEITQTMLASDGRNYRITVTCDPEAGIPENAELDVKEITEGSSVYDAYVANTESVLGMAEGSAGYIRLFDIKIVDKDDPDIKYQPAEGAPVDVRIELADCGSDLLNVVHFADEADAGSRVDALTEGQTVSFEAESFSIYAVVDGPPIYTPPATEQVTAISALAQQEYGVNLYVTRSGEHYYFTSGLNGNNALIENTGITSAAAWFFEPVDGTDNQFRIYTETTLGDGSTGEKYIEQTGTGANTINLSDTGSLFEISMPTNDSFLIKLVNPKDKGRWLQHSGGGNGIRLYDSNQNSDNCRIRALTVVPGEMPNDPYELNGRTTGLLYLNSGLSGEALIGEAKNNTSLQSLSMLIRTNTDSSDPDKIYIAKDSDISMWTFHAVHGDYYKLSVNAGGTTKYLKVEGNSLSLTDSQEDASEIQFIPGTAGHSGKFRLLAEGHAITYDAGCFKLTDDNAGNGKQYLSFADLSDLKEKDFVLYSADKVSVSDTESVKDGTSILIYKRVWNDTDKRYEYYAVDPDGNLVPCFESGDSIEWVGPELNNLLWTFIEHHYEGTTTPNHYYDFYNPFSKKYLVPSYEGEGGSVLSDKPAGVNLSGRRYGDYYTTILAWDDPYYAYAGLKSENGKVVSCPVAEAEDFYFAVMHKTPVEDELTKVATLDHKQYGITMRIADFGNTPETQIKPGNADTSKEQHDVLGDSVYEQWKVHHLVSDSLGADGYPVSLKTGKSFSELFGGASEVNHLFLKGTFDGTGYYEYDSTQNFAHLNDDGNFTIYKELGTMDNGDKPSLKHGQFMPFNDLEPGVYATKNGTNLYDTVQNPLPDDDPRKYEKLYLVKNPDYFFGVELEASFVQTPDGLDAWGHDIIYEFTGDDDFWLYVDGELVIDLGGIHSALPGKVNYRTGEVVVNGTQTTLYDIFRSHYARREGISEDDPAVTAYLDTKFKLNDEGQYVFKDYSSHTMKIYYMERGAGASNLHMRFNLTSVRPDQVLLQKKVTGSNEFDYNLAEYAYQIYYKTKSSGPAELLLGQKTGDEYNVIYPNTKTPVKYLDEYTPPGSSKEYENVFFLSAGETVAINLPPDTVEYKIVECAVNKQVYDLVKVNDIPIEGTEAGSENRKDYSSEYAAVSERQRVEFENHVSENAIRTLTIKKELYEADGVTRVTDEDNTGFTYRLYLGNENEDDLKLAYMRDYYVKDPNGYYCIWNKESACFVSLGKSSYDQLTDTEKTSATFNTSVNGTISKIPEGYQVEVRGLPVDSRFLVEERSGDIPAGYALIGYEREGSTYIVEDGERPNFGTIRENESPSVIVKNKRGFGLTVEKEWSDKTFVDSHGDIYFAVFLCRGEDSTPTLKDGTVRVLRHLNSSVYYYFDSLDENTSLPDYRIMEVKLEGDISVDENGCVTGYSKITPIEDGEKLQVRVKKGEEEEEQEYTATYTVGVPTGFALNAKTDKVTNSRYGVRLLKQDWNSHPLQGADFKLMTADGSPFGAGDYTSGADGEITIAYVDMNTWYTLTEVKAPRGYTGPDQPLKFRLVPPENEGGNNRLEVKFDSEGDYSKYYVISQGDGSEEQMPSITIKNLPFELQTVKVGIRDNEKTPLAGAVFALYVERTVDGVTRPVPVADMQNLTSAEITGLLAGVDQNLAPDVYELEEKTAPGDYAKLTQRVRFTISEMGQVSLAAGTENAEIRADDITDAETGFTIRRYTLKIKNEYTDIPVILQKIGTDNVTGEVVSDKLGGAVFTVYSDPGHENVARWNDNGTEKQLKDLQSSGDTGFFFNGRLSTGTYYINETKAPDGYNLLLDDLVLTVSADGVELFSGGTATVAERDPETGVYVVKISNICGYELPSTGGPGTKAFTILGTSLLTLAGILLISKRKSRKGSP